MAQEHNEPRDLRLETARATDSAPVQAPTQTPKADITSEPAVSTPDAWLERRLRVFERALSALEAKADATAQEHARAIARLEEQLARIPQPMVERRATPRDVPVPVAAEMPAAKPEPEEEKKLAPELPGLALQPVSGISRKEMAVVLQSAREAARAAAAAGAIAEAPPPPDRTRRARWVAIGGLSLVELFLCVGLTMGNTAGASQM